MSDQPEPAVDLSGHLDPVIDQQTDQRFDQRPDQQKPKGTVSVDFLESATDMLATFVETKLGPEYLLDADESAEWDEIATALKAESAIFSVEAKPKLAALIFTAKVAGKRAIMLLGKNQQPDQQPDQQTDQQTSDFYTDEVKLQDHDDEPPPYE